MNIKRKIPIPWQCAFSTQEPSCVALNCQCEVISGEELSNCIAGGISAGNPPTPPGGNNTLPVTPALDAMLQNTDFHELFGLEPTDLLGTWKPVGMGTVIIPLPVKTLWK
jgi:hypothetical protein